MFDENGEKRDKFATKPADSNVNSSVHNACIVVKNKKEFGQEGYLIGNERQATNIWRVFCLPAWK